MSFETWREIRTQDISEADVCIMGIPFDGAASVGEGGKRVLRSASAGEQQRRQIPGS